MTSLAISDFPFLSLFFMVLDYHGLREDSAPRDSGDARFYLAVPTFPTKFKDLVQLMWLALVTLVTSLWKSDGLYFVAGTASVGQLRAYPALGSVPDT